MTDHSAAPLCQSDGLPNGDHDSQAQHSLAVLAALPHQVYEARLYCPSYPYGDVVDRRRTRGYFPVLAYQQGL